jgi:4-amino-4-deoxy-L-arabinose transferase-like glycosyltransferase
MDTSTAYVLALVLCIVLFVPWFVINVRRGKAHGHTWFTWWKPRGHSDIGPDMGGPRLTRPGADDGKGARY